MNYVNYDKSIVQAHHVKLTGWPGSVPFIPPSNITRRDDVQTLLHALRTKKCYWVNLSKREVDEHMESIYQREAAGGTVGCKRKERADKGKKRKRRCRDNRDGGEDSNIDDDDIDETPRVRTTRKGKARAGGSCRRTIKSKAVLSSDSEGDSDYSD
jgi:hypothetical protein